MIIVPVKSEETSGKFIKFRNIIICICNLLESNIASQRGFDFFINYIKKQLHFIILHLKYPTVLYTPY